MRFLRDLVLVAVAAAVSYLVLLHGTKPAPATPKGAPPAPVELAVAPAVESTPPADVEEEAPPAVEEETPPPPPPEPPDLIERGEETPARPAPDPGPPEEPAAAPPPPPESGTPEGGEDGRGEAEEEAPPEAPAPEETAPTPEQEAEKVREEVRALSASPALKREATEELAGRARRGFRTVFLCAARDQLAIARWFGEALVLVPRAGLDPDRPYHFRLEHGDSPRVSRVSRIGEAAPLARFRQYRDLFAFPYGTLPGPLRDLRRSVFNRGDVYLFAALVPPSEWAVVIARRRAALGTFNARHAAPPRTMDDVRRVTMRYVPLPGGGFDIRVAQILFADGTHWTHD